MNSRENTTSSSISILRTASKLRRVSSLTVVTDFPSFRNSLTACGRHRGDPPRASQSTTDATTACRYASDHDPARLSATPIIQSQRQGRTRAWAEHTAWGAIALLSGRDAEWLGAVQTSRLRSTLREIGGADDLLTRMRDRAQLHIYAAHRFVRDTSTVDIVAGDAEDQVDVLIADHPAPRVIEKLRGHEMIRIAAYTTGSRDKERHLFDAAALLACIDDPFTERAEFTGSDRRRIATLVHSLPVEHPAWSALPDSHRTQAQLTLDLLVNP